MFQEAINQYNRGSAHPFNPKVVLFDMDGVLYDSMPNHAQVWMLAMKENGIKFSAKDAYATEGARGVDTVKKYAKAQLGKDLTDEEAEAIYQLKARYFHELLPRFHFRWRKGSDAEDKELRTENRCCDGQWPANTHRAVAQRLQRLSHRRPSDDGFRRETWQT